MKYQSLELIVITNSIFDNELIWINQILIIFEKNALNK